MGPVSLKIDSIICVKIINRFIINCEQEETGRFSLLTAEERNTDDWKSSEKQKPFRLFMITLKTGFIAFAIDKVSKLRR